MSASSAQIFSVVPTMEKSYKCGLRREKFDSFGMLNAHVERQHKRIRDKNFKCNICGYECSSGKDLIIHTRTHTGERPFKCQVSACGSAFTQASNLKTHIKIKHSDERPLKCDFPGCLHKAKTTSNLKEHKRMHSDERPFACLHSGCNFRAKIKSDLPRHKADVHSESKGFICSKCNFKTNSARYLTSHMIVHEGKNENIPCSIDGCHYKGKNNKAWKYHMCRHKTLLQCPIAVCGQYLATKEALKNHLKLHDPSDRAFQCPLCFKHFPTVLDLQKHCFVHTNEKPFQCGHCKYEAASRSQVNRHVSSVHSAIEFPFTIHLLDDRDCLRCKVILPSSEFAVHCKGHVEIALIN